jgi:hypothetical protein
LRFDGPFVVRVLQLQVVHLNRNCLAGNTTLPVQFALFAPSRFSVSPFVQRGAVHEKQMPFMAREGDCPPAPSRAPVWGVHWSEAKTLDGRNGRIRRRV